MKENSVLSGKLFKVIIFAVLALSVSAILNAQFNFNSASAGLSGYDVDTEAECRWCHCPQPANSPLYMPNRHHLKVDQPVPGSTIGEKYNCLTAACHQMIWNPTDDSREFVKFRDCIQCHTVNPYPGHHGLTDYGCLQCHEMRPTSPSGTVLINWCGGIPTPAYDPPTAVAGPDIEANTGQSVSFDGSNSYDTELIGAALSYQWDFGDGSPVVWGRKQTHSYPNSGTYEAKLTVYNYACSADPCTIGRCGVPCLTGSDTVNVKIRVNLTQNIAPIASAGPDIVVNTGNQAIINLTGTRNQYGSISAGPGKQVTFNLTGTRDPDGAIAYMLLEFGDGQSIVSPPTTVSHVYNAVGIYTARLTVYDDDAASATDEVTVRVVNPEICNNGIDDDGNGKIDCADTVCAGTPACALPAPPAAPGSLSASSKTQTSVSLKWTDKADNETGFYIERSPNLSNPVWTRVGQTGANATTFKVSGLIRNTTYKFRVSAYNNGGSAASNILTVTTSR
jgi:PKD repeat protein